MHTASGCLSCYSAHAHILTLLLATAPHAQVSFGEGVVAETVESVVDAAVNTPSFMSFVFAQGLAIGRNTYSVDESILQQVQCSNMHLLIVNV